MLRLTPDILRGAYDFLRTTQPFHRWGLPSGGEVEFRVTANPAERGWHRGSRARDWHHVVGISGRCIGHTDSLMAVMAHEMIHVR